MEYDGQHISSEMSNIAINFKRMKNDDEIQNILKQIQYFSISKRELLTHKIFYEDNASFILFELNNINGPLKMLIDTGASISLISSDSVPNDIKIENYKINLFGITGKEKSISTSGLIYSLAKIDDCMLGTTLHIIDKKHLGNADGILGFDFLFDYNAVIDIKNSEIQFKLGDDLEREIKNDQINDNVND